jgi:hypothetical protein
LFLELFPSALGIMILLEKLFNLCITLATVNGTIDITKAIQKALKISIYHVTMAITLN